MTELELQELLNLTRENNEMLHEAMEYIHKVDATKYRDGVDMKMFLLNVGANVFVEKMAEKKKQSIYQNLETSGIKI